jgi:UDP-N-acetylmuramate dehydrogenase
VGGSVFAGAHVADAVPLAPLTTLRVGPVARRLITCTSTEQVVSVLRQLDAGTGDRYWCLPAARIW